MPAGCWASADAAGTTLSQRCADIRDDTYLKCDCICNGPTINSPAFSISRICEAKWFSHVQSSDVCNVSFLIN